MKRWFCWLLAGILLLCCTACSETSTKKEEEENRPTTRDENPATDFQYIIDDNNNVGIEKYIGNRTEVVIPEKIEGSPVIAILPIAFMNTNIESVDIPDTVKVIWSNAFTNCQELLTVKMGNSVTNIGFDAFRDCTKLKNLTLSTSLQTIGTSAFEGCESLEIVHIPKSVTDWGMEAFLRCPLTSLTFEDGIKKIGSYACFWGSVFKEITIPASVEQIGEYTFHDNLEKVVFLGDAPKEIGKQPFGTKATIYCEKGSDGWNNSIFEKYPFVYQ